MLTLSAIDSYLCRSAWFSTFAQTLPEGFEPDTYWPSESPTGSDGIIDEGGSPQSMVPSGCTLVQGNLARECYSRLLRNEVILFSSDPSIPCVRMHLDVFPTVEELGSLCSTVILVQGQLEWSFTLSDKVVLAVPTSFSRPWKHGEHCSGFGSCGS